MLQWGNESAGGGFSPKNDATPYAPVQFAIDTEFAAPLVTLVVLVHPAWVMHTDGTAVSRWNYGVAGFHQWTYFDDLPSVDAARALAEEIARDALTDAERHALRMHNRVLVSA